MYQRLYNNTVHEKERKWQKIGHFANNHSHLYVLYLDSKSETHCITLLLYLLNEKHQKRRIKRVSDIISPSTVHEKERKWQKIGHFANNHSHLYVLYLDSKSETHCITLLSYLLNEKHQKRRIKRVSDIISPSTVHEKERKWQKIGHFANNHSHLYVLYLDSKSETHCITLLSYLLNEKHQK